ncbi:MAG: hypothetical protein AMJ43_05860 [Coxiella sp. DG_40]|nr:MAG: hypothetical protein AMJ43_05860 [Coxiella sp. DG_40]
MKKSLNNLIPFEKGHKKVGGRKKGTPNMITSLKKFVNKDITYKNPLTNVEEKKSIIEWINLALVAQAIEGNIRAIKVIYDRIDGKVTTELKGNLGVDLTIEELEKMSDEELKKIAYGN